MGPLKATTIVKPGDGFEHWHQVTCRDFSRTECVCVPDHHFRARISVRQFGALTISDISYWMSPDDRVRIVRSPADVRMDPRDDFMLWLTLGANVVFEQGGHEARMQIGDLVLHDQSQPFGLEFGQGFRALGIFIPRALLTARWPEAPRFTARSVNRRSKLGALAGSMVRHLLSLDGVTEHDVVSRLGASALDIFATTLDAELADRWQRAPQQEKRLAQVKKYMLANLHNPELDLDAIGRAQNMAPRTLNRLFAREGTTPMRWLWQQRLAGSFTAIAEGKVTRVTDAALSHGFSDLSHFSRAFKTAFGRSPHTVKPYRRT
jgi:AraC-like DNA-binding protein